MNSTSTATSTPNPKTNIQTNQTVLQLFDNFIENNGQTFLEPLSPKNNRPYIAAHKLLANSDNDGFLPFGSEGNYSLFLYKRQNHIYLFMTDCDTIDGYRRVSL